MRQTTRFGPHRPAADMGEMENLILWCILEKFWSFLKISLEKYLRICALFWFFELSRKKKGSKTKKNLSQLDMSASPQVKNTTERAQGCNTLDMGGESWWVPRS